MSTCAPAFHPQWGTTSPLAAAALCWAGRVLAHSCHPEVLGSGAGWLRADSCSPQIKVMHKQLLLFHNAISAYFAGNQQQLEQTLKQFNIKLKTPGAEKPSWLEEQ